MRYFTVKRWLTIIMLIFGSNTLSGCMITNALERSTKQSEVFISFEEGLSNKKFTFLSYKVDNNGEIFKKCAEWSFEQVIDNQPNEVILGKRTSKCETLRGNIVLVPIVNSSDPPHPSVDTSIEIDNKNKNLATIILLKDGQQHSAKVMVPVYEDNMRAWGYFVTPFAWLADTVTFPFQAIYFIVNLDKYISGTR